MAVQIVPENPFDPFFMCEGCGLPVEAKMQYHRFDEKRGKRYKTMTCPKCGYDTQLVFDLPSAPEKKL